MGIRFDGGWHYILFGTIGKSAVYLACLSVDETATIYTYAMGIELMETTFGFVHDATIQLNVQRKQTRKPD